MPLFRWMKWSHETREESQDGIQSLKSSGIVPSCMLITELLWHVEEHERLAREREWEHSLAHSTHGLHWFQYPRLRTLIPTSDLHQLEFLCSQIQPIHAATIVSRFHEVLATNNIRPWELVAVFKQVLRDFLRQKQYDEEESLEKVQPGKLRPMEALTNHYKLRQGFVTPTVTNCGEHLREEIPTISGYVDRAMRLSSSITANRDWKLPYYYPLPSRPKGAYSTTL